MTKKINNGFRPFIQYTIIELEKFLKEYPSKKIKEQIIFELSHRKTRRSRILHYKLTGQNLNLKKKSTISEYESIGENLNICRAWEEGNTKQELQKKYKLSYAEISMIIEKGISKKEISREKRKQIKIDKIESLNQIKLKKKQLKATTLTEKEKIILNFRKSGLTLEEIGRHYGVSRERIRQISAKIRKKGFDIPRTAGIVKKNITDSKNKQIIDEHVKLNPKKFIKEYKKNLSDRDTAKNLKLNLRNFKSIAEIFIKEGRMDRRLKIFNAKKYMELKKEWDEIAAMRKAGYSNQKIASILDTSIQMISIKIERMKSNGYQINPYGYMKDRDYSMEQDQETIAYRSQTIKKLNNQGLSKSRIADELHMDYRSLCRHIDLYMINY
jgi:DNA-binding CsgD family transcriptional regulator